MMRTPAPKRTLRYAMAAAGTAFLWTAGLQSPARAEADLLQQAINYVFTGAIDPKDFPEITDRKSCTVVLPDPKWKRYIRYYLNRIDLDDPRISSTYAGRQAFYKLDVESSQIVVEYLTPDKKTVVNGYKSAQIPLPGDIDRTRKAVQFLAAHCKNDEATKLPF